MSKTDRNFLLFSFEFCGILGNSGTIETTSGPSEREREKEGYQCMFVKYLMRLTVAIANAWGDLLNACKSIRSC
ncbi:hypothetical protein BpHYR1_013661 [Brachionus plicatilis]|uniref:Uncharacterized protein n=1 Tax=Brachionus plicatilis TaxID=10195 RepID=A0A3M7SXC6_BRAPC|nr:hypothetical protein BpHYR1_013661 [Brachionus plicatilis]